MSTSCCVSMFLSDGRKQDAVTTNSHIKHFIELLKERKLLTSLLTTFWVNNDGYCDQYIRAFALYILSVMS